VRLLRALGPLDRPVSGREAARLAGLSRRAITSLDELAALGVVIRREAAGQHLYTLNQENVLAGAIEYLLAEEARRSGLTLERIRSVAAEAGAVYAHVHVIPYRWRTERLRRPGRAEPGAGGARETHCP
jgi:hypothetical protein